MWRRLKNKLLQIFSEQEEQDKEVKQEEKPHLIESQALPRERKRSFRFPLIPDEPLEQEQEQSKQQVKEPQDIFIWKENNVLNDNLYQSEHTYKQKFKHLRARSHQVNHSKSQKRFVPSRVASPIYGYQKRKDRTTIEQVPTFMRERRTKPKPLTKKALDSKSDEKQTSQKSHKANIPSESLNTLSTTIASHKEKEQLKNSHFVNTIDKNSKKYQQHDPPKEIKKQNMAHINSVSKQKTNMDQYNKEGKKTSELKINTKQTKTTHLHQTEVGERNTKQTTHPKIQLASKDHDNSNAAKKISESKQVKKHNLSKAKCDIKHRQSQEKLLSKHKNEPSKQKQHQRIKKRKQTTINSSKNRAKDKRVKSTIPFNVMMTPQDYRNLEKQKDIKKAYHVPLHLLEDPVKKSTRDEAWVIEQKRILEQTLKHFKVAAKVVHVTQGPTVTRFEVKPAIGVKVSRVRNLSDDIKLNMAAKDIRIEAPIPGKNTIGIEIPNREPQTVSLHEILQSKSFQKTDKRLPIGLGLTVEGKPLVTTVGKMPHGLIAGATGSGKSVCINTILLSLIYQESYEDLKLLLIDPKMVELAPYNGIPHLVAPVITDVKAATAALKWAVNEMEERYEKFVSEGVRDINRYNEKMLKQGRKEDKLPYIVIVIDELADLMMVSPQDVEDAICRIAQKARAAGMHLIIATQRPSVDVITGLIKANIPTRIAFSVSSQVDSRTILDSNGAERLLGRGDMLFVENGSSKALRLQGAFVSDHEIERITNYLRELAPANYLFEQDQLLKQVEIDEEEDELFPEVVTFILEQNQASTSMLQRHFRIGYNRAARLIDSLEEKGIISGPQGSKPRQVLMSEEQLDEMING